MTKEAPTWTVTAGDNGTEYSFSTECFDASGIDVITNSVPSAEFKFRNTFSTDMNNQLALGKRLICKVDDVAVFNGIIDNVDEYGSKKDGYVKKVSAKGLITYPSFFEPYSSTLT